MKDYKNPLALEDIMYTIEEFGAMVRRKFGGDNYISDVILGELFLNKFPFYSCKFKKSKIYIHKKNCGCC